MNNLVRSLTATSRQVARLTGVICIALIYLMLALLSVQVFLRYFFGAPPSWTEELSIAAFGWIVLLYATVGVREGFHVVVDVVPLTSPRLRLWSNRLVLALIFGFGLALTYFGLDYVEQTHGQHSAALQYPIEMLHLAVAVCGGLTMLHSLALFVVPADGPAPP